MPLYGRPGCACGPPRVFSMGAHCRAAGGCGALVVVPHTCTPGWSSVSREGSCWFPTHQPRLVGAGRRAHGAPRRGAVWSLEGTVLRYRQPPPRRRRPASCAVLRSGPVRLMNFVGFLHLRGVSRTRCSLRTSWRCLTLLGAPMDSPGPHSGSMCVGAPPNDPKFEVCARAAPCRCA